MHMVTWSGLFDSIWFLCLLYLYHLGGSSVVQHCILYVYCECTRFRLFCNIHMDIKKGLYIYSFSIILTLFAHTSESLGEPRQTWIKLLKREAGLDLHCLKQNHRWFGSYYGKMKDGCVREVMCRNRRLLTRVLISEIIGDQSARIRLVLNTREGAQKRAHTGRWTAWRSKAQQSLTKWMTTRLPSGLRMSRRLGADFSRSTHP